MATYINQTKNSTSFTNEDFTAGQTLEQSPGTFEEQNNRIIEGIAYKHEVKNTTSFTNETKN